MQGQGAPLKPGCSREGVIAISQQLHVEQSWHFRGKTMDCIFCVHFSHAVGTEAEVTHPVVHCSISVLASKEQPNKEELSRQERDSNQGWRRALLNGSQITLCSPSQDTAANPSE